MRTANCYFSFSPTVSLRRSVKEISFKWSINSMTKKQQVNGISLICQFTILGNFNLPRVPQTIGTSNATKWLSIFTNRGIIFHQDRIQIFLKLVFITFLLASAFLSVFKNCWLLLVAQILSTQGDFIALLWLARRFFAVLICIIVRDSINCKLNYKPCKNGNCRFRVGPIYQPAPK